MTISRKDAIDAIARLIFPNENPVVKHISRVTEALSRAEADENSRISFEEDAEWVGDIRDLINHSDLYVKSVRQLIGIFNSLPPFHRAAIELSYTNVDEGRFELDILLRGTVEAVERITQDWRAELAESGPMRSGGSKNQRLEKIQKKRCAYIAYQLLTDDTIDFHISPGSRSFIEVTEVLYDLYTGRVLEDVRRACGEVFREFAAHKQRYE